MQPKEKEVKSRIKWRAVTFVPCAVILVLALVFMESSRGNTEITTELKAVMIENLVATEAEDLEAVMNTMHTQSPNYSPAKELLISLTETYDVEIELLSFSYIGLDDEYALARAKQSTTKVSGPEFRDNVIDTIQILRKENGKWKFWAAAILEISYMN